MSDKLIKIESHHNPCHYFQQGICKSCNMMDEPLLKGRSIKQENGLKNLLSAFPNTEILHFFGLTDFRGSRQKAKLACFNDEGADELSLGIYNLQEKISLENCPLYSAQMQSLIAKVKDYLIRAEVKAYDIHFRRGEAKFVIITESLPYSGEAQSTYMVRIVLRSKESLDRLRKISGEFLKHNPEVKLLSVNIQPEPKAIIEGEEEILLTSNDIFINGLNQQKLNLTVKSFSQINSIVGFQLYEYVKEVLKNNHVSFALDLYCGVGGFSLSAREVLSKVWGVEISSDAVRMANLKAREYGLSNFEYLAGDVEKVLKEKLEHETPEAIIVNPPRSGLSQKTSQFIKQSQISLVIYSSCNPETFTRDALILKERYELLSLKPFDMFMMTDHFEVVGIFKLKPN